MQVNPNPPRSLTNELGCPCANGCWPCPTETVADQAVSTNSWVLEPSGQAILPKIIQIFELELTLRHKLASHRALNPNFNLTSASVNVALTKSCRTAYSIYLIVGFGSKTGYLVDTPTNIGLAFFQELHRRTIRRLPITAFALDPEKSDSATYFSTENSMSL